MLGYWPLHHMLSSFFSSFLFKCSAIQKDQTKFFTLRSVILSIGSKLRGSPVMQILFDQVLMLILSFSYIQSLNWFIMLLTHYKPGGKTSTLLFVILKDCLPCRLSPFTFLFFLSSFPLLSPPFHPKSCFLSL